MTTFKFPAGVTAESDDDQYWAVSPRGRILAELFLLAEGEDEGDYVETSLLTCDEEPLMIHEEDWVPAMQILHEEFYDLFKAYSGVWPDSPLIRSHYPWLTLSPSQVKSPTKPGEKQVFTQLPDPEEITRRCKTRGIVTFTRDNGTYEFQIIRAHEARDYDGSNEHPWPQSDHRTALQRKFIPHDGGKPRYTNHWGWGS